MKHRVALFVSLVAGLLLPTGLAHAETTVPLVASLGTVSSTVTGGTPLQRDAAPAGNDAPYALFGTRGTRALSLSFDMGAANSGLASRPLGMGGQIALDSFVIEGLSIGGEFGFDVATADGGFYEVGGGPRVGYAVRLGDKLTLWPMITMDYKAGTVPGPTPGNPSLQDLRAGVSLPLVLTLGGQVAFELGPVASTDLWRSVGGQDASRMDILGMRTGIVGWF
ncbi:MAG TPA: hypothetical protein VIF09_06875 [Polyangiaceae bacterium]|jgi:hypothetical protein